MLRQFSWLHKVRKWAPLRDMVGGARISHTQQLSWLWDTASNSESPKLPLNQRADFERCWASRHFANIDDGPSRAFFTLKEFADRISAYRKYTREERRYICEYGYSPGRFVDCVWLDELFSRLCFYQENSATSEPTNKAAELGNKQVRILRSALLDVLLKTLKEAEACLQLASQVEKKKRKALTSEFWRNCVSHLNSKLTYGDAEILLQLDGIHTVDADGFQVIGHGPNSQQIVIDESVRNGGLVSILEFIGHVMKECLISSIHEMADALSDLRLFHKEKDPTLSGKEYPALDFGDDQHYGPLVNRAIDDFIEADWNEREFWREFRDKVWEAVDALPKSQELTITAMISDSHREEVAAALQRRADQLSRHFKTSELEVPFLESFAGELPNASNLSSSTIRTAAALALFLNDTSLSRRQIAKECGFDHTFLSKKRNHMFHKVFELFSGSKDDLPAGIQTFHEDGSRDLEAYYESDPADGNYDDSADEDCDDWD